MLPTKLRQAALDSNQTSLVPAATKEVGLSFLWVFGRYRLKSLKLEDETYHLFPPPRDPHELGDVVLDRRGRLANMRSLYRNKELNTIIDYLPKKVTGTRYAHLLQYAGMLKDVTQGKRIHARIAKGGARQEQFMAREIVKMYLECRALDEAKELFFRMPVRDSVLWRYMVTGCARFGFDDATIKLYRLMQQEGLSDVFRVTLTFLYTCAKTRNLELGKMVHQDIVRRGLDSDVVLNNGLLSLYSKCQRLDIACLIFDYMPVKNVASWHTMISSFTQDGYYEQAIVLFYQMNVTGLLPNRITYAAVLNACQTPANLELGQMIHNYIQDDGRESDVVAGSALVRMYACCGNLQDAHDLFRGISKRNVISWTGLIYIYIERGYYRGGLNLYSAMMEVDKIDPTKVTFLVVLRACKGAEFLADGITIHGKIIEKGLEKELAVAASLISMYGHCGSLRDAERIFNKLHQWHIFVWNAMIAAYVPRGYSRKSLKLFRRMQLEGVIPDSETFATCFNALGNLKLLDDGRKLHAVLQGSSLVHDENIDAALLSMYSKCGSVEDIQETFNNISRRTVEIWNAVITGYAKLGYLDKAMHYLRLAFFEGMVDEDILVTSLNICTSLNEGRLIHDWFCENEFRFSLDAGNELLRTYFRFADFKAAVQLFENMPEVNTKSWNIMVAEYALEDLESTLELFQLMQQDGCIPDEVSFAAVLEAIGRFGAIADGMKIHKWIAEQGYGSDPVVGSALIGMYSKCGNLQDARRVFANIEQKDVHLWNTMIGAYNRHGRHIEALNLYRKLDLPPDDITFLSALDAAGNLEDEKEGKAIHRHISESKLSDVTVENALLEMYSKCGKLEDARDVFDKMLVRDTGSWNMIISAYVEHGQKEKFVFKLFHQMLQEGFKADSSSFLSLLKQCSFTELAKEGCHYFASMKADHGMLPTRLHYECLVDIMECGAVT